MEAVEGLVIIALCVIHYWQFFGGSLLAMCSSASVVHIIHSKGLLDTMMDGMEYEHRKSLAWQT